jgi:hypothetical protein
MTPPTIMGLGITQQWSTTNWKATGYVDGVGWLKAEWVAEQALAEAQAAEAYEVIKSEENGI